jgi:hypothetical protein
VILFAGYWFLLTPARAGLRVERPSDNLDAGLVGHWTFDGADISGNVAYDRSGQGNNGTIASATLTIGKLGQALNLDGVNDTVTVADHPSLDCTSAVTVSAWFYPRSLNGGWHVIAAKGIGNNSNYGLWHDGSKFTITFATSGWINHYTNQTYSPGRWYHLVGILDSANNNARLYVDGQLDIDNQTETTDTPSNNDPFYITADYGGNWADGIIDDVRVYNRALSADEVTRLYNIGKGVVTAAPQQNKLTTGLVGYWSFNGKDISGTIAYDRSGNGYNGTISGATKAIGKLGQALNFDEGGNNVSLGTTLDISALPFTVSAWVKPTSDYKNYWRKIFSKRDSWGASDMRFDIDLYTGTGEVQLSQPNSAITFSYAPPANVWTHLIVIARSGATDLYVNGALQETLGQFTLGTDATAAVFIGMANGGDDQFHGGIDEVRVYNRALAADEVKALYNQAGSKYHASQENQLATGLVGYWPFNGKDISGNTAYDRSGQNNNGTINGATKAIGKLGQGLSFDGLNAYVTVTGTKTYAAQNSPFSVSAWAYLNSFTNGWPVIVKLRTDTSHPWYLLLSNDTNYLGISVGSGSTWACLKSGTNPDTLTGKWQHFATVYNGAGAGNAANFSIYSDGQPVSMSASAGYGTYSQGTEIGSETGSGTSNLWQGLIDDVRVYNRALSAEEIKRLYNMGR